MDNESHNEILTTRDGWSVLDTSDGHSRWWPNQQKIANLKAEAGAHGDIDLVDLIKRAESGDDAARLELCAEHSHTGEWHS